MSASKIKLKQVWGPGVLYTRYGTRSSRSSKSPAQPVKVTSPGPGAAVRLVVDRLEVVHGTLAGPREVSVAGLDAEQGRRIASCDDVCLAVGPDNLSRGHWRFSIQPLGLDISLDAARNHVADALAFAHAPAEVGRGDADRRDRDRQDLRESGAE